MSDINAAPSSTEPSNEAAKTDMQGAGTAVVGELGSTLEPDSSTSATSTGLQSIGASSDTPSGENSNNASVQSTGVPSSDSSESASLSSESLSLAAGSSGSGDAPAVARSGEGIADGMSAAIATSTSNAAASGDAGTEAADAGNAAASPAAGQSASDTASSVQVASPGSDTEAAALRAELDEAHAQIAALEQQVTDEQERVIKWQSMYNAACAAKPHAQSLLQKLEAGEAIVLGDLQSRLRALVDAL
ncbi:hypothetical protein [Burkholderia cenocepacia]|uniref:hypothetical protein n=1 Tax=Burkholderia cenocepacia TaxID=95486 RepID=UPI0019052B09|nr:hypothetical protein [Burkholderia cenocepacia]MBJ9895243.1 hypothetical protein [Burkholderia cenocepacia]MBJ9917653.1 hypothetical protein [Burkholderia cenocepacia]